ncbi:MAG: tRNA pseudouridine(55) synthase TruB [Chloroflexota bacterium]|nr:tRNA pseudouridine(55) synthase TruB [Chloroflexota bacterium]
MNGIFNINKPPGLTSHDVVARIRRLASTKRVGHAGTLDPIATGVLPIVLGQATRLVEYLADADKAYRATLSLGATSSTYDREGTVTATPGIASMPTLQQLDKVLDAYRGQIRQLPPMHSAIKIGGKKLYELARAGIEVERQPRHVTITRLEIEVYDPPTLGLFVECSKGTYIRSLAHDLGQTLGTGAYLQDLQRTRHGPFSIEGSVTLDDLRDAFAADAWQSSLYPPDFILAAWPVLVASPQQQLAIIQGKPINLPQPTGAQPLLLKAVTQNGDLLAIMSWDVRKSSWQPHKVFLPEAVGVSSDLSHVIDIAKLIE